MKLSPEDKAANERQRLIETSKQYSANTYCRKFVAPLFQRMIRAEDAAYEVTQRFAVKDGDLVPVPWRLGFCVCITCGKALAWDSGIKGMHTGHFAASRRNSILLLEENCAPQCSHDNFYRSGAPAEFRMWMLAVRGIEVIERIEALKRTSVSFTLEELVDRRIAYKARLDAAIAKMQNVKCEKPGL
jgi:hypothetical protein